MKNQKQERGIKINNRPTTGLVYALKKQYYGVTVKEVKTYFTPTDECDDPIIFVKPQTKFIELDKSKIRDENGDVIPATGTYFISAETIYPYHIVIDVPNNMRHQILEFTRM